MTERRLIRCAGSRESLRSSHPTKCGVRYRAVRFAEMGIAALDPSFYLNGPRKFCQKLSGTHSSAEVMTK